MMKQSSSAHVNWQTSSSEAAGNANGSSATKTASRPGASSSQVNKSNGGDSRKVITAQKKTQVAIGRPGFNLGRS
ncbi:hypothetical protein PR003_g22827 [Phytophthora rubi]|uniref:Uncharacterized protein n=1 Tax=Phytophthora rubi TaxID=129364 RepID=A0A6A3J5J1_9STRA|nr:hypothetical protein PR002_g22263 [Phytophthora rubi]KAE8990175.1 hypothetical protein PR001_g21569 [Phytophthora rubi]KAE9300105.1 hypothetical protein PR003_g22827 [Phytophthora rubi]